MDIFSLFKDYNAGDILWLGDWGLAWVLALLGMGVVVVGLSAYDLAPLPARRRWTLVALRALVYGLAVLMLLEPALDLKNVSRVKNHIAVVVDTSQSMQLRAQADDETTRMERAQALLPELGALIEQKREEHEFSFFSVSEGLEPLSRQSLQGDQAAGRASNLGQALSGLQKQFEGRELGGVVLISDGIDSGAMGRRTRRGEPLDETSRALARALDAPINTMSVARATGLKDLAIARILHEDFAFVHNKLSIEVELQVTGMDAMSFPVTLWREGEALQTRQVTLQPDQTRYEVKFEFVPKRLGKEIYAVTLPEFEGEALHENNRGYFLLRVIRDKIRALQVVGRPSWDERFLRRFLKRNPNVDLVSFFILRTNQSLNDVPTEEMSLIPFPTKELFNEELGSFDLVIFQNFNFGPYDMRQYLPNIAKFVKEGGGFAMIGGDLSFESGGYAGTPIEEILPVALPQGSGPQLINEQAFRPQLTEAGHRHPITQLAFDPATNARIWSQLPEQQGTNMVLGARDWGTVLARHPTLKTSAQGMPVLTIGEVKKGRVMALTTDATWRWGFEHLGSGGTPREYQLFWNNAIRWLIKDPELKLVKLELADDTHAPGASVPISVRVSRPDYTPDANRSGELLITRRGLAGLGSEVQSEAQVMEPMAFKTGANGVAHIEFMPVQPGAYELTARIPVEQGAALEDQTTLLIIDHVQEWRDIIPREELLEALAEQTQGAAQQLPGASLSSLRLKTPRAVKINRRKVIHLWDSALAFLAILLLLAAEWTLRRRWGRL